MTSRLLVDKIEGKTTASSVQMPSGHVIQTVVGSTSHNNTGSATFSSIGSGTITPVSTSSKILLIAQLHIYVRSNAGSWRGGQVRFKRDSTAIFGDIGTDPYGNAANLQDSSDRYMEYSTRVYLDSPSTTSSVTYTIEGASRDALVNIDFNNPAYGSSSFYLQEIA